MVLAVARRRPNPLAIALVVAAVLLVIVGIIYVTTSSWDLPGFIPGKPGDKVIALLKRHHRSPRKFTKRGIAAMILAAVALLGAYYAAGLNRRRRRSN